MAAAQDWLRVNPPRPQHHELERGKNLGFSAMPEAMFGQQQQSSSRQHPRRNRRRGAPGQISCSRSSDEILQRTTNVALSPVTGPGTSFSSVASAFGFQHHLGSDPASELLVLKHILTRECLLSRLETVCDQLRKRFQLPTSDSATAQMREGIDGIVALLSRMRDATVAVIEAISVWRKDMAGRLPSAFVWHGDNYLLKITNDLNFLAGVQPLVDVLKLHPARFCRNPLMLPQTLDEQRRDGELCESGADTVSPGAGKRRHLYQVAQVLLDEEILESERDSLRQESSKYTSPFAGRGEAPPELSARHGLSPRGAGYAVGSCATTSSVRKGGSQCIDGRPVSYLQSSVCCGRGPVEDNDTLWQQQRLSTWYEQARSQLVSLSTSHADEEYFLSSRRFWSKEELRDTGGGSSPPLPHRRPPGTLARSGKRLGFAGASGASGRGSAGAGLRDMAERFPYDGGNDGSDLFGGKPPHHQQMGSASPPPHQTRRLQGVRVNGQPRHPMDVDARQSKGGHDERGGADVWSRPDRFGGKDSAALSCLTAADIEQVLREVDLSPATAAVCAAVVFLLAPEGQLPVDFLWPQGFEGVALPAEDFLRRLHEISGATASSSKAQFLAPVLQREYLLPEVIELQGGHAVASLCAWALEELQLCEEFAEWSEMALEPWYETQLLPAREHVPESNDAAECEVRLIYKALHMLPHVGGSYVVSLFEGKSGEGGLIVRAFDRANRDTFWLALSQHKIAAFGGNATRSPATLAAALTRRLKMKVDVTTGSRRLVLPPVKRAESSEKKARGHPLTQAANSVVGDIAEGAEAREEAGLGGKAGGEIGARPRSPSFPLTEEPATVAAPEGSARTTSPSRTSYPPPVRGSMVDDLGPLVEVEGDGSECSAADGADAPPASSTTAGVEGLVDSAGEYAVNRLEAEEVAIPVSEGNSAEILSPMDKTHSIAAERETPGAPQEDPVVHAAEKIEPAPALVESSAEPRVETTIDDGKGKPGSIDMEGSGSYADDFTLDDNEGAGLGPGGEVGETGAEESGCYADDFAVDEDENDDDAKHLVAENQEGLENKDQLVRVDGEEVTASAYDVGCGGSKTSSTGPSGPGSSDADVCLEETSVFDPTVTVLGGADLNGKITPSEEVDTTRGKKAGEEDYENEFLEEDAEQGQSTKTDAAPSDITKQLRSSSVDDDAAAARGGGAPTSHTPRSEQYVEEFEDVGSGSSAGAGAESAQHTQEGDDDTRGRASTLRVQNGRIGHDRDGFGGDATESVPGEARREVQPRNADDLVVGNGFQQEILAEAATQPSQDLSLDPTPTPILIDLLGDVKTVSVGEGYASEFEDAPEEATQDGLETSTASDVATALVAAAADLAVERVSGVSGTDVSSIGADEMSGTEATATDKTDEDRMVSSEVVVPELATTGEKRFSEGKEPPTAGQISQDGELEERFVDAADDDGTEKGVGSSGDSHAVPVAGATVSPVPSNRIIKSDRLGADGSARGGVQEAGVKEVLESETCPEEETPDMPPMSSEEGSGGVADVAPADAVVGDAAEDDFEEDFEQEEAQQGPPARGNEEWSEAVVLVPEDTSVPAELEPAPPLEGSPVKQIGDENDGVEETEVRQPPTSSPVPETVRSPPPFEEETEDGAFDGGPVGGQAGADEAAAEGEDFEDDFEEEFPSGESNEESSVADVDQDLAGNSDMPEVGSREEPLGAAQQDDGRGKTFSDSEVPNIPESVATAAEDQSGSADDQRAQHRESLRKEELVDSPPPLEEVRGNQAEDHSEESAQRGSVNQAATSAGEAAVATPARKTGTTLEPPSDEFGDDFEDDFEDP